LLKEKLPDVVVADMSWGKVPGPLSQMRVCPAEGVAQVKFTPPAGIVSGVGEKKSLATVIVVLWPPLLETPPPVPPPP
jgi:hypothetical protein